MDHTPWMQRCLQLALNGAGQVAPNPLVGAVLVQDGRILAEGWHRAHGGPHAEAECLLSYGEAAVPGDAVMYVSLEPCSHTGLTPPCAELLIARGVRNVVVGCQDPDPRVAGGGVQRLREAGINVATDVLREACRWVNRRFITSVERQRPYIILKWARSSDGFLDRKPREGRGVQRISCFTTDVLVHRWRSEEQAIMVGGRTVLNDDPVLDVRHVAGRSPMRVVLDRAGITPVGSRLFKDGATTLLFTVDRRDLHHAEQVLLAPDRQPLDAVLQELHRRKVRSLLVEGGGALLGRFLDAGLWDEAREIVGDALFLQGTAAPRMEQQPARTVASGSDRIHYYARTARPGDTWDW